VGFRDGHWEGTVNWFDVFDRHRSWQTLADAPLQETIFMQRGWS
jgi:hypothetical protein